jgi:hypothetical protein
MALCNATIGLGALLSDTENQMIDLFVAIDQQLLEQRRQQLEVGSKAAKASGDFAYNSLHEQSEAAKHDGDAMITNGSLQIGFQVGGYLYGNRLNGDINEANENARNAQRGVSVLEENRPMGPVLHEAAPDEDAPEAVSFRKFENGEFKYDHPLTAEEENDLSNAPNGAAHKAALEHAREAKKNFEKQSENLSQQQSQNLSIATQIGNGLGMIGQGFFTTVKESDLAAQAAFERAKTASDYLNSTAQAIANTLDSLYSSIYGHISTMLQAEDALFNADSARLG